MNSSNFNFIVVLILVFVTTVFLLQNTQVINVNVLVWTYYTSVAIIIISMLFTGILFGWFMKGYSYHKNKKLMAKESTTDKN